MNDDPLAALDQLMRGLKDFGRLLWAHYEACVMAGFTPDQALALTTAYQAATLFSHSQQLGDDA